MTDNYTDLGNAANSDEFTSYVEFENEDGTSITLEIVDYFEYENDTYAILVNECDCDDPECNDEVECCVLKVISTDEGEEFVEPDEDKFPALQRIVEQIFEEECSDDDCDCGCGCGEHHHE